jgi:hypothetical protein
VKLRVAVLPRLSVALQVTVVVPTGNTVPDAFEQVTGREPSTRSVAVVAYVTVAPDELVAGTVRFPGTVNAGGVVSTTTTVNRRMVVFCDASLAEHRTDVSPSGNVDPDSGLHSAVSGPVTVSLAVTV